MHKNISLKDVLNKINKSQQQYNIDEFKKGMDVEMEHGKVDPETNVTNNDPIMTGKIALAHIKESPRYYEKLEKMEQGDRGKKESFKQPEHKEKWSNSKIKTVKRLTYRKAKNK